MVVEMRMSQHFVAAVMTLIKVMMSCIVLELSVALCNAPSGAALCCALCPSLCLFLLSELLTQEEQVLGTLHLVEIFPAACVTDSTSLRPKNKMSRSRDIIKYRQKSDN